MSDMELDTPGEDTKSGKTKATVDVYRDLLRVEVRALVHRVGELTQTVGDLFTEVNHIAIQLESASRKSEQAAVGVQFHRTEIGNIKEAIVKCENQVNTIHEKVQATEDKIIELEIQIAADSFSKES